MGKRCPCPGCPFCEGSSTRWRRTAPTVEEGLLDTNEHIGSDFDDFLLDEGILDVDAADE